MRVQSTLAGFHQGLLLKLDSLGCRPAPHPGSRHCHPPVKKRHPHTPWGLAGGLPWGLQGPLMAPSSRPPAVRRLASRVPDAGRRARASASAFSWASAEQVIMSRPAEVMFLSPSSSALPDSCESQVLAGERMPQPLPLRGLLQST